jgi:hypothetical protein
MLREAEENAEADKAAKEKIDARHLALLKKTNVEM